MMKNILILGSTGSIGESALEVIRHFPDRFKVTALSTNCNVGLLERQIEEFSPKYVCIRDEKCAAKLKLKKNTKLFVGEEGLREISGKKEIDRILLSISGSSALAPLLAAIDNSKEICLANKEALVMAGSIVMQRAKKKKAKIFPVDSEQSAIWQCLDGKPQGKLKNIYLTASGGPFRTASSEKLRNISVKCALNHPRWKMGKKITVDSATLMNKGLELLEAMFLFGVPAEKIKILIHPEAIIHSMVEFVDGVLLAQLSATDMRIPIQYALSYPERLSNSLPTVDFYRLRQLNFAEPDFKKFPCLRLSIRAAQELGTLPAVLNAANEVCVEAFLKKKLKFMNIAREIEEVMDRHKNKAEADLEDILEADGWARREAQKIIERAN